MASQALEPLEEPAPLTEEQRKLRELENEYREKFVNERNHPSLADPYLLLEDVYKNEDKFKYAALTPEEEKIPKVFTRFKRQRTPGEPAVVSEQQFFTNWKEFTKGMFEGLDWNNVFAAGGSVVGCLNSSAGGSGSDIDLFIWGLDSDEEANAKLRHIHQVLQKNQKSKGDVIRTSRAVTFIGEYPYRHVQVILRRYKSPAEVLLGFDIDSCSAGFNGTRAMVMERFRRAITKGYNLVDTLRRSTTYESRLFKYSTRGFIVAVPDLDKKRVDPKIFTTKNIVDSQGLVRLLLYEYIQNKKTVKPAIQVKTKFQKKLLKSLSKSASKVEAEIEHLGHISDYCDLALPWGPTWFSSKVIAHLQMVDKAKHFGASKGQQHHRHIFVTGIDGVINGVADHKVWCLYCRNKVALKKPNEEEQDQVVFGELKWEDKAPVLQDFDHGRIRTLLTGSFTVKVQLSWEQEAYLPADAPAPTGVHPLQKGFIAPPDEEEEEEKPAKTTKAPKGAKGTKKRAARKGSDEEDEDEEKDEDEEEEDEEDEDGFPIQKHAAEKTAKPSEDEEKAKEKEEEEEEEEPASPRAPASTAFAGTSDEKVKCHQCDAEFSSMNAALKHARDSGHSLEEEEAKAAAAATSQSLEKKKHELSRAVKKLVNSDGKLFHNLYFSIFGLDFNIKQGLMKLIMSNGGRYSYLVALRTTFVIATNEEVASNSFGVEKAKKLQIPIVTPHYILDCISNQQILDFSKYLVVGAKATASAQTAKHDTLVEMVNLFADTPKNNIFSGFCFSIRGFPAATKTILLKLLYQSGAQYSYTISAKVTHIITTQKEIDQNRYLVDASQKYDAPFLSIDFIIKSVGRLELVDLESHELFPVGAPSSVSFEATSGSDVPQTTVDVAPASSVATTSTAPQRPPSPPPVRQASAPAPSPSKKPAGSFKQPQRGKAYSYYDPTIYFPEDYEIVKTDILQVTRLQKNNNKFYVLELHKAVDGGQEYFRVFSHFGRTDDLTKNPNAGMRQCRYSPTLQAAEAEYGLVLQSKTGKNKGYRKVDCHFTANLGSDKARALAKQELATSQATDKESKLSPELFSLVKYIYDEAVRTLTTTVAANITPKGIETPLGILSHSQIQQGEAILRELREDISKGGSRSLELSGEFFTAIPHRIGRSQAEIKAAAITTIEAANEKEELLQLMRDMLKVNETGALSSDIDAKYAALRNTITPLAPNSEEFARIKAYVLDSQVVTKDLKIVRLYKLHRQVEADNFTANVSNQRNLFHGSRIGNWVGLLSRGLLLPQAAVAKFGVTKSASSGWLGNGIYFGSAADTSAKYATAGQLGTAFMLICKVALGKVHDYTRITVDLNKAPEGFDSTHGVRARPGQDSDFGDDEFVVYDTKQQHQAYLVEFQKSA